MAANDSPTSICNLALGMLGEDPIDNISPPQPAIKSAILCAQFYDVSRRAMLASALWKCAKRPVQQAAAQAVPPFEYGNAYTLPADFIRPFKLQWNDDEPYELMNLAGVGRCIVTDHGAPVDLYYIFDLQDCTEMDPLLVMAVAADLAAVLAIPLARDISLKQTAEAEREARLAIARTSDAQQNSPREWDVDVLLGSRF